MTDNERTTASEPSAERAADPTAVNERYWSERASFHLQTPMYREFVQRLRDGTDALLPLDDALLGSDLGGLEVLHLQCHVGTDTLSLARRGANVTGLDFSEEALRQARELAADLQIPATFVHGNAVQLPDTLTGPFDLIYTSYGALCWLDDLNAWARGIAARLRPGGRLVVIDSHPLSSALGEDGLHEGQPVLAYPYLAQADPKPFENPGSYADRGATTQHTTLYEWFHGIGQILSAVHRAALTLTHFEEHPESYFQAIPEMVRGADRLWRLPDPLHGRFPLTFSLVATR